jgi:hypothetical protein
VVNRENTNAAFERLAETTRDSYRAVLDLTVAQQERNIRFARDIAGAFGSEYHQQVDKNLAAAQELYERSERQYGAWAGLLYTHLSYYDYYRAASDFSRRIAT